ncbi:MAG: L-ribulose-5-phosphate 4-epimerase AraD [Candidatus Hydrogenedentes bacterium]|nr:L-ribulose-5-phosphate 4-epimerase AraD [Candidatus Hydrogenedentota bacterium]
MLDRLKADVLKANLALVRQGLVLVTWGNASGIDRDSGHVVIKPSGVAYEVMTPEDMAVVDLDGKLVAGKLKPSVDTPTHLALYRAFPEIGGVVHTHSHYATCWAQACRPIPCFGTTHADHFNGEIPVTDAMTAEEVGEDYEAHIGDAIVRAFRDRDPMHCPGVLVANHAPFVWGKDVATAVESAYVLEEVARMALHTLALSPGQRPIAAYLLDKHFMRKHGAGAYYGQGSE